MLKSKFQNNIHKHLSCSRSNPNETKSNVEANSN